MLVIVAVGFVGAGLLLATTMPAFKMRGRTHAWTCLVAAQQRLRPPVSIVLVSVIGLAFLAVAIWQSFRSSRVRAPVAGGDVCRAGF